MNIILVTTKLPNRAIALQLAQQLVASKLAACVNIHAPCYSIYHWQGKIESAEEIPLTLKTTEPHYAAVEQMIRRQHPYELPEIVCVPVTGGLPEYLQWVAETVSK